MSISYLLHLLWKYYYFTYCNSSPLGAWVRKSCFKLSYVILLNTMNNIIIKIETSEINQRHAVYLNGFRCQDVLNTCNQKDLGGKDWKLAKVAKKAINRYYWGWGVRVRIVGHCLNPVWIICCQKRNSRNEAILGARRLVLYKVGEFWREGKKIRWWDSRNMAVLLWM